jgi:hypothetical protein
MHKQCSVCRVDSNKRRSGTPRLRRGISGSSRNAYCSKEIRHAVTRQCLRCKGSKVTVREAFDYKLDRDKDGAPLPNSRIKHYPRQESPCYSCCGAGEFDPPDLDAILKAIKGRKGLCSKRPDDSRSYYVWRMARFHGGADVTMPMTASMDISGDPFRPELDLIASAVAKRVFGTDGAGQWA